MLAEAINRILSLAPIQTVDVGGLTYSKDSLFAVRPPKASVPHPIGVLTLSAIVDLVKRDFEYALSKDDMAGPVVHVANYAQVSVITNHSDDDGQRTTFAAAVLPKETLFEFGQWLTQEQFIIGINALFLDYGDKTSVLSTISRLETDDRLTIEDDGIGQTATAKASMTRNTQMDIKPRVVLKPYRTFREVEQPPSEFILRVKRGNDGQPKVALFEADGARWKLDAALNIKEFLAEKLADTSAVVIA